MHGGSQDLLVFPPGCQAERQGVSKVRAGGWEGKEAEKKERKREGR